MSERCEHCETPFSDDRDENGLPYCMCEEAQYMRLQEVNRVLSAENAALQERIVELDAFLEHCEYQKDIMGSLSFNTINQYKKRIKELESKLGLDSA